MPIANVTEIDIMKESTKCTRINECMLIEEELESLEINVCFLLTLTTCGFSSPVVLSSITCPFYVDRHVVRFSLTGCYQVFGR